MIDVAQDFGSMQQVDDLLDGRTTGQYTISFDGVRDYDVVSFGDVSVGQSLPSGAPTTEQYVLRATADVFIPAGTWTFAAGSDDGVSLRVPGATFTNRVNTSPMTSADMIHWDSPRSHTYSSGTITVPAGGLQTTVVVDFYENGGGDSLDLHVAPGQTSWGGGNFQLLGDGFPAGWRVMTTSSSPPPDYNPLIGTNIQSQMLGRNGSAYIRVPLNEVLNPLDFEVLRLRVRYDDAFVAYLNGVEIARRNYTGTPLWNALADSSRSKTDGIQFEEINLPVPPGVLNVGVGTNVLAIQGMNDASSDPTFLIDAELIGVDQLGSAPRYFSLPTPGASNAPSDIEGKVADTNFSVDRGFYTGPFSVAITTTTQGAQIRYTLDGTAPSETNGVLNTGPIHITRTTTLRAIAYKPGMLSSDVDTQTYLFTSDIVQQSLNGQPPAGWPSSWSPNTTDYGMDPDIVNNATWGPMLDEALKSIPTFSVVMNLNDLFGGTGIYSNPGGDGRVWERPASLELINPDGSPGFQANAGIRLRGGFSRSTGNPKHAFRFFFRSEYGDAQLEYPLFGQDAANDIEGFDLRTFQNYSWSFQGDSRGIFIRDQVMRDAQLAMGQPGKRGEFYHLYINGQYWGLFNTDERTEASYAADYFGGQADDYDVVKPAPDNGYNVYATDGNMNAWADFWNQLLNIEDRANLGQNTDAEYLRLLGKNANGTDNPNLPVYLDPDNLIDYMMVIYYGGNYDAPLSNFLGNTSPNNFFATRNRNLTAREGWKYYVHDAEHSMVNPGSGDVNAYLNTDRTGNASGPWPIVRDLNKSNPQFMFQILVKNPEFRMRVADRIHKWFHNDGVLTPAKMTELVNARKDEIFMAVVAESARWGDAKGGPFTRTHWQAEMDKILNGYLPFRTDIVFQQLVNRGWYANVQPPNFSQFGGPIPDNFQLTITNPNGGGTIYYTTDGSDPRLRGGGISPTALVYTTPVTLPGPGMVKSRVYIGGEWSPVTEAVFTTDVSALRVTEIMYNPAPPAAGPHTAQDFEFIELMNTGNRTLNLRDVTIDALNFTFGNVTLQAGQRIVLVKNQAAFQSRYPGVAIGGVYTGSLDNGGERIAIRGPAGTVLDFNYDDDWYPVTDGLGYSLVVVDPIAPALTYGAKANWRPSNPPNGDPGVADPGVNGEAIVINEVLANSTGGSGDWIELYNSTGTPINIGGWFLSNDPLDLDKYQLSAGTSVPANGYLILTQQDDFGSRFTLSELGDDLFLTSFAGSALGGYREGVDFGASAPGITFGRFTKSTGGTDFVPMSAPTQGAANAQPLVGPVVMTEIMYHPAGTGAEFIELQNLTGADINVGGWKFIEGINYMFPAGSTIPAFGYALVVGIDPATFRSTYNVPANVPIFGPFTSGTLDNNGGNLRLGKPGTPVGDVTPYVQVDQVKYDNSAPWPAAAGGSGPSITRVVPSGYGNDAGNWIAGPIGGTPGVPFTAPGRPTNLTATTLGPSRVRLDWTDNTSGEDGYRIERSTDNVAFTVVGTASANAVTYEDSGLAPNTFYYYRIRAFNNAGESGYSNRASARTQGSQTLNLVGMTATTWRYNQARADLGSAWFAKAYDDNQAGWATGTGVFHNETTPNVVLPAPRGTQLALGPAGDRTPTFYFRIHFNLTVSPSLVTALRLTALLDDGAVFYINGNPVPIHTSGMNDGETGYNAWANRTVSDATSFESPVDLDLTKAGLVQGDNVLAVEVHQVNNTSSDVVFGASLAAEIAQNAAVVAADITDVTPDPRSGPVDSVTITFSEAVTGFDLSDLSLSRSAGTGANLLTGSQTLASSDGGRTWVLGNLGGLTFLTSDYNLHLLAGGSGITGGGKILAADASESFRVSGNAIQGTAGNDTYYIRVNGSNLEVFATATPTGVPIFSAPLIEVPSLTINGVDGNDSVEIAGALPFVPTFNGGTGTDRLIISAGLRRLTGDLAGAESLEELVVGGSGRVEIAAAQTLASLSVRDSGRLDVESAGLSTAGLTVSGQGVLDLHDNDLIVKATAATRDALLAAISGYVRSARNGTGGRWTGPGVTSSVAAGQSLTGLAVIAAGNDVVVKYTYNGDATGDGLVDADDYFRIDSGFLNQPANPTYGQGNFNYDTVIDADDYFLIDSAFLGQGAPLGGGAAATVSLAAVAAAEPVVEQEQKKARPVQRDAVETLVTTRRTSRRTSRRR